MDLDSMAVGGNQLVIDTPYLTSSLPVSLRFTQLNYNLTHHYQSWIESSTITVTHFRQFGI